MLLSVFTPSNRTRYLDDCYASLAAQSYADWEWVVLLNGGATAWRPPAADNRVKVSRTARVGGVGAAKRAACALASGDVLVELDHDDMLSSGCLARLADVFAKDPSVVFACSDWAQIGEDGGQGGTGTDASGGGRRTGLDSSSGMKWLFRSTRCLSARKAAASGGPSAWTRRPKVSVPQASEMAFSFPGRRSVTRRRHG